jgi:phenylpropionate dioxygenase-like ring-hydroxylating dioxygenase large terminal subunit
MNQYVFIFFFLPFVTGYFSILNRMIMKKQIFGSKITDFPKLNYRDLTDQNKYDLQWYVIGQRSDFIKNKPIKTTIWNKNYVVWRTNDNQYVGLNDVCSHKSASLSGGKVIDNHIICPYHGYEFNENGTLDKIPGISFHPCPIYDVSKYKVVEKNGWVYLNTFSGDLPFSENIFVEPEFERNDSVVFLDMDFNCYSRIVSENSLDVMHIGFVHTFGNSKRPAPIEEHNPIQVGPYHYKTSYLYEAGDNSFARKLFGVKDLRVENEFILPHTTIARIYFDEYISTVITFALPISETKSRLFVKTYRNFWANKLGDLVTENWMFNTILQDKVVIENIDRRFMEGKFNMKFDKLQNTYKTFYKRTIHNSTKDIL